LAVYHTCSVVGILMRGDEDESQSGRNEDDKEQIAFGNGGEHLNERVYEGHGGSIARLGSVHKRIQCNLARMEPMNIPAAQIAMKKKVGTADGKDLTYIKLVGGLHMITNHKGVVVGSGPHKAVARHIAGRHVENIQWSELSKADHLPFEDFAHLLPKYEAVTDELRKAQGV